MQTSNALSNLKARYKAVLKKCHFNNKAASLALMALLGLGSMVPSAFAVPATSPINPEGSTVSSMNATDNDYGIAGSALNSSTLVNEGTINGGNVYNTGLNITVGMFGYENSGAVNYNFNNSGILSVSGGAFLFGMHASANGSHTLINSGSIQVNGTSQIYGIFARSNTDGSQRLINSGSITVTSTRGSVYGMSGSGSGSHRLINSGEITVSGTHDVSGISVSGTPTGAGHWVHNTGVISATASAPTVNNGASEVFGNTPYNVGTFATTLRPWSNVDSVFGNVFDSVNLTDASLIFRPQVLGHKPELGVNYALQNLVVINGTAVDVPLSSIGSIGTEVPFLQAVVTGGHSTGTASVRLDVNEDGFSGGVSSLQNLGMVQGQMQQVGRALRKASQYRAQEMGTGLNTGSDAAPNTWQSFLTPYVNFVSNGEYNFDGDSMGVTGGLNYNVTDAFSLGVHFDLNASHYNADLMDMSTKSHAYAVGVHAAYDITPEWYVNAQFTGSFFNGNSNYSVQQGAPLWTDSSFNGSAFYASVNTGYTWEVARSANASHSLTPEVGLSYLSMHTSGYDMNWKGDITSLLGNLYDVSYDDSYYSALYGMLNLTWRSAWQLENDFGVALTAALGLRQNLSGNEIENVVQAFGGSYNATAYEDMTTWTANAGVELSKGDFSLTVSYDGAYGNSGSQQSSHGVNAMVKLEF